MPVGGVKHGLCSLWCAECWSGSSSELYETPQKTGFREDQRQDYFVILWKMWWSSHVTINMQSFLHPCPYAWTTVGTRCKLGLQSLTAGMTRCKSTHVHGFFFITHLSISQHVLKSFDICFDLFCWAHLSQTAWQITIPQATIITQNYLTNQWCNFILKFQLVQQLQIIDPNGWTYLISLRLRRFSSRRFP